MTFESYVRAIRALAEATDGAFTALVIASDETWRIPFADGLEPDEALDARPWAGL